MKMTAVLALICLILGLLIGCVVSHPRVAPPPLKQEVRPVKPSVQHVWIPGHWKWAGGRYVWVGGHWTKPKAGKVWVPGYWKKKGSHYVWVPGHWR